MRRYLKMIVALTGSLLLSACVCNRYADWALTESALRPHMTPSGGIDAWALDPDECQRVRITAVDVRPVAETAHLVCLLALHVRSVAAYPKDTAGLGETKQAPIVIVTCPTPADR